MHSYVLQIQVCTSLVKNYQVVAKQLAYLLYDYRSLIFRDHYNFLTKPAGIELQVMLVRILDYFYVKTNSFTA